MVPGASRERVRCRLIGEEDLAAIARLLHEGFAGISCATWQDRLDRLRRREVAGGLPRYGYCLDAGGRLVGVILLVAAARVIDGAPAVFCNVASWYVIPDYRAYAQLLVSMALRKKDVTYTNVTPAPQTWPIVENQGYTKYCSGLFVAAAALKTPAPEVRLTTIEDPGVQDGLRQLPEHDMLRRHHAAGCAVVLALENDRLAGFVFRRYRIRSGKVPLPAMLVIHGPDRQQLIRLAGNFGRWFMMRGAPFLVMDADGPVAGLRGVYTESRGRKYFKGPHRPALCDLGDTELAIFGV
jgi:hypothetical protein